MDTLEERTEEMNAKIDEVHSLLKNMNETLKNDIESNKNNPKMIEFAASPSNQKASVYHQTETQEYSKPNKDERDKRNSWDQKLMSVIAAFTNKDSKAATALDSGNSQVYQSQQHPSEVLMDSRRKMSHAHLSR